MVARVAGAGVTYSRRRTIQSDTRWEKKFQTGDPLLGTQRSGLRGVSWRCRFPHSGLGPHAGYEPCSQGHLGRRRSQAKRTQVQQLALGFECAAGAILACPGRLVTQLMDGDPGAASALWPGASPMVLFSW